MNNVYNLVNFTQVKGLEKIFFSKKLIAIVFRKSININGVRFFTDEKNPFQVGIHNHDKNVSLMPHFHKIKKPLSIKTIQEILFVLEGKILVTLYTKGAKVISKKTLSKGDSILLISQGHGVKFLEKSRIFEVKQGPYPGQKHAKEYFKEVTR